MSPCRATTTVATFDVRWSGEDDPGGSGIASYDVYLSVDGAPFTLWIGGTTETSVTFAGPPGHTYAFYSVARDNVGHVQPTPDAAQATIQVNSTAPATTTSVSSGSNPTYEGDSLTFRATVSAGPGAGIPAGWVQFAIDGVAFGTPVALVGGVATSDPIATLAPGNHAVIAAYLNNDGLFAPSQGSLAGGQTVIPAPNRTATTTTLTTSSANPVYGQSLTFTATVHPALPDLPAPTGEVRLRIDGADFGTPVALVNGSATSLAIASLSAGSHTISAIYSGDAGFFSSAATDLRQTVAKAWLTIRADDKSRELGQANPPLTASYSGFVNGDGPSSLTSAAVLSVNADLNSPAGIYPITVSGAASPNYQLTFIGGILAVTPTTGPNGETPLVTVVDVQAIFKKHKVFQILVTFSGPVDAAEAQKTRIYRLATAGKKGSFTAKNAKAIPLKSAAFSAASNTVTLTPTKPFKLSKPVQLQVQGRSPSGLEDPSWTTDRRRPRWPAGR